MIHNSFTALNKDIFVLRFKPGCKLGDGLANGRFFEATPHILRVMQRDINVDALRLFLTGQLGTQRFEKIVEWISFAEVRELTRLRKIMTYCLSHKGWQTRTWSYENMNTGEVCVVILEEITSPASLVELSPDQVMAIVETNWSDPLPAELASMMLTWLEANRS